MTAWTDRELRRLRAEAARTHHPDLGGNAADLVAAWQTLDEAARARTTAGAGAAGRPRSTAGPEVRFVRRPTGAARWWGWLGLWRRTSRRHRRPTARPAP